MAGNKNKQLEDIIKTIARDAKVTSEDLFEPPPRVRQGAKDLSSQNREHRDKLLKLVMLLSILSFVLLALATLLQMIVRIWMPYYTGISDTALNILAISVFGEVIAVVATIVHHVWKQSNK